MYFFTHIYVYVCLYILDTYTKLANIMNKRCQTQSNTDCVVPLYNFLKAKRICDVRSHCRWGRVEGVRAEFCLLAGSGLQVCVHVVKTQ